MRHFSPFSKAVGVGCAILGIASSAHSGVVTGSPVPVFTTTDNSRDILLSTGSPTFTANLSSYASFSAQTHSILGVGTTYPGTADVEHQDNSSPDVVHGDIALPYAMVGRNANGQYGHFIWKVVLPAGFETGPAAQINASVYFRHDPNSSAGTNAIIGISDSLSVYSDFSGPSNFGSFTKKTAADVFGPGTGFATYTGSTTMAIPSGLTEFYVDFSDEGSSARWALTAFSINANPVAVPEPVSFGLVGLASVLMRRRK